MSAYSDNNQQAHASILMRSTIYSRNQQRLEKIRARKKRSSSLSGSLAQVLPQRTAPMGTSFNLDEILYDATEEKIEFHGDRSFIEGLDLGGVGNNKIDRNDISSSPRMPYFAKASLGGAIGGALESLFGRTKNDVANRLATQIVNSISSRIPRNATGSFPPLIPNIMLSNMQEPISKYSPRYTSGNTRIMTENTHLGTASFKTMSNILINERAIASMLSAGVLFGSHAYFCNALGVDPEHSKPLDSNYLSASALTGVTTATLFTPFESLRSKLMYTKVYSLSGNLLDPKRHVAREIVSVVDRESLSSLFSGYHQVYTRELLGNIAFFSTYLYVKRSLDNQNEYTNSQGIKFHPIHIGVAGGCAGFAYWSLIYPFDTLRAFVQAPKSNYWAQSKLVNGISTQGLYRGYISCICRAIPANAILFLGYEFALKLLS